MMDTGGSIIGFSGFNITNKATNIDRFVLHLESCHPFLPTFVPTYTAKAGRLAIRFWDWLIVWIVNNLIQPRKFTKEFGRGFIVGKRGGALGGEISKPNLPSVDLNSSVPSLFAPRNSLVTADFVFTWARILDITALRGNANVCASVVRAVAVFVIDNFTFGRIRDLAVHVYRSATSTARDVTSYVPLWGDVPLEWGKCFVVAIVNQGKKASAFFAAKRDLLGHKNASCQHGVSTFI